MVSWNWVLASEFDGMLIAREWIRCVKEIQRWEDRYRWTVVLWFNFERIFKGSYKTHYNKIERSFDSSLKNNFCWTKSLVYLITLRQSRVASKLHWFLTISINVVSDLPPKKYGVFVLAIRWKNALAKSALCFNEEISSWYTICRPSTYVRKIFGSVFRVLDRPSSGQIYSFKRYQYSWRLILNFQITGTEQSVAGGPLDWSLDCLEFMAKWSVMTLSVETSRISDLTLLIYFFFWSGPCGSVTSFDQIITVPPLDKIIVTKFNEWVL